eukprot:g69100.t1
MNTCLPYDRSKSSSKRQSFHFISRQARAPKSTLISTRPKCRKPYFTWQEKAGSVAKCVIAQQFSQKAYDCRLARKGARVERSVL